MSMQPEEHGARKLQSKRMSPELLAEIDRRLLLLQQQMHEVFEAASRRETAAPPVVPHVGSSRSDGTV
jgi:hypothetical protein